jgi:hypothetical protein
MKSMHSRSRQGANRSDAQWYREDLQRRLGREGMISYFSTSGLQY